MNIHRIPTYIHDLDITAQNSVGIEKLKNKSILITGATGTIGSYIVDTLLRYNQNANANIKIYAAGRNVTRLNNMFSEFGGNCFKALFYDVFKTIQFDIDTDFIIHAAGNAYPAAFNNDPVGTIIGNIDGTFNLLNYANIHHVSKFVYVSSGEIYGISNNPSIEFEESYNGYLDINSPRSSYPLSKRTTENLCFSYNKQYKLETLVVRPSHTYGPVFSDSDNRVIVQFFKNAIKNENIVLKSSGLQKRNYTYIADTVSAILTVLFSGNAGEAYNIANPNSITTIADLAKIVAHISNKQVIFEKPDTVDLINRTPIQRQILNSKKVEELGWTSLYNLELGIKNSLKILKNQCS